MVARSISGSVILGYNPSEVLGGAEVTVDTGTSFSVNAAQADTTSPSNKAQGRRPRRHGGPEDDDREHRPVRSADRGQ